MGAEAGRDLSVSETAYLPGPCSEGVGLASRKRPWPKPEPWD